MVMSLNLRGKDCSGDLLAGEEIPEGAEETQQIGE